MTDPAYLPGAGTVTVHPAGGTDRFGDPVPGPDPYEVPGCVWAPRGSSETTDRSNTVIVGLALFAPFDAAIPATAQVEVEGRRYEVEGEPGRWANPFTGDREGLQVALRHVSG